MYERAKEPYNPTDVISVNREGQTAVVIVNCENAQKKVKYRP